MVLYGTMWYHAVCVYEGGPYTIIFTFLRFLLEYKPISNSESEGHCYLLTLLCFVCSVCLHVEMRVWIEIRMHGGDEETFTHP